MFDKVLIANRGEVAVRVVRACRDLGVISVIVHSAADADSVAVRSADEAVLLEGDSAAETYLNVEKIVAVARATGAQAVHPGYGFLSENAALPDALASAGIAFVGPSASAIDEMGSKISARKVATAAGVPTVPGVADAVQHPDDVGRFAAEHGYPVAIKASFGGGGRGMRVVRDAESAATDLEAAQREAQAYFGRPEVYLERYLEHPRHVEIQIVADTHGNVVWVGDRDCSVQRRHQKLIEEAPASVLDDALRNRMGEAAVAIAREVGYVNAGTLEFLVEDDRFYFLEMNTRLQVEHPVTELVSGIDLVREQLRIAAGEPLSVGQREITSRARGHAIEIRLNAEDPAGGRWTPTPGTITELVAPGGFGVRFDAGYASGDTVTGLYDGLVAKLVVRAEDRPAAIARARRAIGEMRVEGIKTSLPAQLLVLDHPDFVADRHSTRWLEDTVDLASALPVDDRQGVPSAADDTLPEDRSVVTVGGRRFWVPTLSGDGAAADARRSATSPPVALTSRQARTATVARGDGTVRSPMQGTVVRVEARVGDRVEAADVVCVVEAMKMENPVQAGAAGVVREVHVAVGDGVPPGATLVVIEPGAAAA